MSHLPQLCLSVLRSRVEETSKKNGKAHPLLWRLDVWEGVLVPHIIIDPDRHSLISCFVKNLESMGVA